MSGASITLANLSDISENTIYYPFDGYDGNIFDIQGLHYYDVDVIAGNTYDKCFASHEPESPKGSSKGTATFTLLADGVPFYISSKPYNYGLSWDN